MFYRAESYTKRGNDVYLTPEHAIDQLLYAEPFVGHVLEPACGDGRIVEKLKQLHYIKEITAFDIVPSQYGPGTNFLEKGKFWSCDHVITNPPYRYAEHFVDKALRCANGKVAMLLRLAFLEGQGRKDLFQERWPLKSVYVFSKRLSFGRGSGTMAFAWFVFDNFWGKEPVIRWI